MKITPYIKRLSLLERRLTRVYAIARALGNRLEHLKENRRRLNDLRFEYRTWQVRLHRLQRGASLNGMHLEELKKEKVKQDYDNWNTFVPEEK